MIQRIQTLFLIEMIFLGISLFFVPIQFLVDNGVSTPVHLIPMRSVVIDTTLGLSAAAGIVAIMIILSLITIFLFKKRELQVKLCYLLVILDVVLICMIAFCPFVNINETTSINDNVFAYVILIVSSLSAYLAAFFIKKDIELLKSADRIR